MSNDLIPVAMLSKAPAHIQSYYDPSDFEEVTGGPAIPRLSIKGRQFTECGVGPDGVFKMPVRTFEYPMVILDIGPSKSTQRNSKAFYSKNYTGDDDEMSLPDCFSKDGLKPDASVGSPIASSCTTCPYNVFGYVDDKGEAQKGKRCSDHKSIYFVKPDALDGDIWMLRVPATSLKLLNKYLLELKKHNYHWHTVVTAVEFVDGVQFPQIRFKAVAFGNHEEISMVKETYRSEQFQEIFKQGEVYEGSSAPAESSLMPSTGTHVDQIVTHTPEHVIEAVAAEEPVVEVATPQPAAVEVIDATPVNASTEVDVNGTPWDARIHSTTKSKTKDGAWRKMRGVSDEQYNAVIAEIGQAKPAPVVEQPVQQQPVQKVAAPSVFEAENATVANGDAELDELLAGLDDL
jgi:hypothetical protein